MGAAGERRRGILGGRWRVGEWLEEGGSEGADYTRSVRVSGEWLETERRGEGTTRSVPVKTG